MREMTTRKNAKSRDNSAENLSTQNRVGWEGANYNISFIKMTKYLDLANTEGMICLSR